MNWVAPIKDQETLKNFGETLKQIESQMVNRYYKGFLSE